MPTREVLASPRWMAWVWAIGSIVLLGLPVVVATWATGILICLDVGLKGSAATVAGFWGVVAWIVLVSLFVRYSPRFEEIDGSVVNAERGTEDGPESECAIGAPRPVNTTRSAYEHQIAGALKSCIDAHGPITRDYVGSAAKRVASAMGER